MSEDITSMWDELDNLYQRAEISVKNTAEEIWEFYHEVATSALGHTYGDRMEYYSEVGERYCVSVATVRLWVREGKRDKEDFLTRGKLSSIAWKEKKKLEAETAKTLAKADDEVIEAATADLLDGSSYEDTSSVDAFFDSDIEPEEVEVKKSPLQGFESLTDELNGWRALGFATPSAAILELERLRKAAAAAKPTVLTKEEHAFITELASKRVTDLKQAARLQEVLTKLQDMVG